MRFDALGGVDKKNCTLTRLKGARDLVGKVHVTRGINEVHDELFALMLTGTGHPRQAHILRLDGDATLALDVHVVQVLVAHVAILDHSRELEDSVGEGGLAVIDVGNDAEVANSAWIRERVRRVISLLDCHM